MLVWFLLCGVVQSQLLLTGTIRPLSSSPSDTLTLNAATATAGLAQTTLGSNGRPVFNSATYSNLFSTNPASSIAYTIAAAPTPTPNLFQYSASPFYDANASLFTYELVVDISNTSLKNQVLQFNSGGDLWVYFGFGTNGTRIGGTLAVDLGGPHNQLGTDYSLNWNTWTNANFGSSSIGGQVRMYVFYAHRSANTPMLKITLSNQVACSAETVGVIVPKLNLSALDTAAGVGKSATQTINGNLTLVVLANTSLGGPYEAAFAWFPKLQRITSGFVTQFDYLMQGNANGFAFVFHNNNRQTAAVGGGGVNLGYAGQSFTNQAALEFDVFNDGGTSPVIDAGSNRIELHTKYEGENTAAPTTVEVTNATLTSYGSSLVLNVTGWTNVIVSYAPSANGLNGYMTVWVNNTVAYTAQLNHTRVLSGIGENVFFGFTTSNGPSAYPNNVFIQNWRLWTTPISGLQSFTTNVSTTWNTPRANDVDVAGLTVHTRDPCGQVINLNGLSTPFTISTTMSPGGSASYAYLGSGLYTISYHSMLTGNYSLYVSFDGQQISGSPFPVNVIADVVSQYSTFNVTSGTFNGTVIASHPITLLITARDRFSNMNYETLPSNPAPFVANWATEPTSPATVVTPPYYTVTLTTTIGSEPISRGVFVTYNGSPLVSTFSAVVVADTVSNLTQFDLPGGQFQSIAAGVVNVLTITPYDRFRNRIMDFPGGTISFRMILTGSIFVDPLGPVVWTTNLTNAPFPHWELKFMAQVAGRYSFFITYNGVYLDPGVTPVVVAGPIAGVTLSNVPATVVSSLQGQFTILTQDAYGNLRIDPSALSLVIGLNGVTTTCGLTSTLTSGSGITGFGCAYQGSFSGRYGIQFTPSLQTALVISVYLNGTQLNVSGTINVVSGAPDPSHSQITSASTPIVAGTRGNLTISLADVQGNIVMGRALDVRGGLLLVSVTGSSAASATFFLNLTTEISNGVYNIPFTATTAGTLTFSAAISGNNQNILQSGLVSSTVIPSAPYPPLFVVAGPGLATQQVLGSMGEVTVALRDTYNNVISGTNYSTNFSVSSIPVSGSVNVTFQSGQPFEYKVDFLNPATGTNFLVNISFGGVVINGGRLNITLVNNLNSTATCVFGTVTSSVAGSPLNILVADKGPLNSYAPPIPVFSAELTANGVRVASQTVLPPSNTSSNIWNAIFQSAPTLVGVYSLYLYLNGQTSSQCGPCNSSCQLNVTPGLPAGGFTKMQAVSDTGTVGTGFFVNITVYDQFGNLIPNPQNITLSSTTTTNSTGLSQVAPGVLSTFVTTFVATPWELKAYFNGNLIVSHVFVSLAGIPASAQIIDFASNGTTVGVAGQSYDPSFGFRGYCLVVQDIWNQTVTSSALNNNFTMTMKPAAGSYNPVLSSTLTTAFDGTPCYQIIFTPTSINPGTYTPFEIRYGSTLLVVYPNAIFVPGNVDVSKVQVLGLKDTYMATEAFQFSVLLADSYSNNISTSTEPLYGSIKSLPARGHVNGQITAGFSTPLWSFTYPGTANVPGQLTYAGNWSIELTYKGASLALNASNGFVPIITVTPGPIVPTNTIVKLPVINVSYSAALNGTIGLVAGTAGSWSYWLFDQFLNPVDPASANNVTASFIPGVNDFTSCDSTNLFAPDLTKALSPSVIAVTIDGVGGGTLYSTVAQKVSMYLQVNGEYIYSGPCINVLESFVVHPAQEDAANTLIAGPTFGIAGAFVNFVVVLRDTYNNSIDRGGASIIFGPNNQSTCNLSLNVLTIDPATVDDYSNGTYRVNYQTNQSQLFLILVSIDNALAGFPNTCRTLTISPWYADSSTHSAQKKALQVRAGMMASIQVQAFDIFGNIVHNQAVYPGHHYLGTLDRSLCPMYVKKTTSANSTTMNNAGAPWIGWDSGSGVTSGCVSGSGDLRTIAAQALRLAINNGDCYDICDTGCQTMTSASDLALFAAASSAPIGNGAKACAIFPDPSATRYALNYEVSTSTSANVVPPFWTDKTSYQTSQSAFFVPEYPGQYSGVFLLFPDPNCSGCVPRFLTTNAGFQVDAATCEQQFSANTSYRCLDGTCQSSRSLCNESCSTNPYKCFDGRCSASVASCGCPLGYVQCAGTYHCVPDASQCPSSDSNAASCPTGTTSCWNGVCAPSGQCPTQRVCPPTFILCANSQTCVRSAAECTAPTNCTGMYQCQNGYCVSQGESCPSVPSCGAGVVCPDGSCAANSGSCSDVASCYEPIPVRCPDGSCRAALSDCPTSVTCPVGMVVCDNGLCSNSCSGPSHTCSNGEVRCADGTCKNNEGLCPTRTSCTSAQPVLCPDGSCAVSVWACAQPPSCNSTLCSTGFCASSSAQCPTLVTCPFYAPVKCPDGQCQTSISACTSQPTCPFVQCPDGSCHREFADCPTISTCPSNLPVRCADGSCQAGAYMCPVPSCGSLYRCPGGECMETKAQCPTRVTCPSNYQRCVDGSCRSDCSAITVAACPSGQFACPQGAYGLTCATDISRCPFAATCPSDRPVRCLDATCVFAAKDCITTSSIAAEKTACPDGGWASNGADNCYQGVTCPPWNPVKCWDNSCRHLVEDCPKQGPCPVELGGRYLCSDGTCARTLDLCASRGTRCQAGMVKCPTGTCVTNPAFCPNGTSGAVCPDQATLCMDGSCRRTPSIWCRPLLCPLPVPYLCPNGACAVSASHCPMPNGCPYDRPNKCVGDGSCVVNNASCPTPNACTGNGTFLCADGSGCSIDCGCIPGADGCLAPQPNGCKTAGQIRCHDGLCKPSYYCTGIIPADANVDVIPGFQGSNLCPMYRPFRCSNGLCAASSSRCPVYPSPATAPCPLSAPFLCANGMCVMTGAQCPVLADCPKQNGIKRCPNGYCDTTCPSVNTCPATQNFRCSNGMCVASPDLCVDATNNNCPTNQTICPDGHCRANLTFCPPLPPANGCAVGMLKCSDGSCQATCPKMLRCPYTHPYICSGACSETACAGGTMSANGCGVATPFRCANGDCKRFPARLGNTTSDRCAPTIVCDGLKPVLCGDGSCVSLAKHCRPIICSTTLCPDRSCPSSGTCPALTTCPASQPVLCPDGTCRTSIARCASRTKPQCVAPNGHQCWDGSCKPSLMDCAIQTSKLNGVSYTGAELVTTVCSTGLICPNGMCALVPEDCDIVPACPYEAPMRCWNGGCYASQCPTKVECTDKKYQRCEDGTCRTTCLNYNGCPLTQPYFCPGRATPCVLNSTYCDSQALVACSSGCNRDVAASKQSVTISPGADTTIEVGLEHNLPRLRVTFYSGAFQGTAPALVDIVPFRVTDVQLSSRVLSTPFRIQSQSQLAMNLGVDADIDWQRYQSSTSFASAAASITCELQANYEVTTSYTDAMGVKGTCTGEANITTNSVGIHLEASGTACMAYDENLAFVNQTVILPWSDATQQSVSCLCTSTKNHTLKYFRVVRNRSQVTVSAYALSQPGCPSDQEVIAGTGVISYNFNPVQNSVDACYLIVLSAQFADADICLGVLSENKFRCPETREDRVNNDWNSPFDQPGVRRIGRVRTLNDVYAFIYSPLPPDFPTFIPAVTWWQLYGTTTLASSISFGVVMICAGIILFNFNRFRQKYKLEKEHLDHLKDQVADLDQFAGGLGMTDEGGEFDMVANPMVIEMDALQKQVETANDHLHGQAEEDNQEIEALELERRQLFAEIQRVKEAIAANEKGKAPKRVVEAPPAAYEAPAVVASMAAPKSTRRTDFGQVRATRKPKDIE